MTRNLPEPRPETGYRAASETSNRRPPQGGSGTAEPRRADPLEDAIRDLREQLSLHRRTGVAYIRVHTNQGGVTAARAYFEEPLPPNT